MTYRQDYCAYLAALTLLFATPSYAGEWYLDASAGATSFIRTIEDGTWIQDGLPHSQDLTAIAWRAGLGYHFNKRWSIQAHYLNIGTAKLNALVVADEQYDPKAHQCLTNCANAAPFNTKDTMQGGELSVTRTWQIGPIQPFLRAGGALMFHHLQATFGTTRLDMHGRIPMGLVGGGLCYGLACLESTYYRGIGGDDSGCIGACGFPISKQAIVSLFTVRIPLGGRHE